MSAAIEKFRSLFGRRPLRLECEILLERRGLRPARVSSGTIKYFFIGRWLVRADLIWRFLLSPHCRLADIIRLRLKYFTPLGTHPPADLILVRDAVRPKISIFSLAEGKKEVLVHYEYDFLQELNAIREFESRGIDCLRIASSVNDELSFMQPLVGKLLGASELVSEMEAESVLLDFIAKSRISTCSLADFLDKGRSAIDRLSMMLSPHLSATALRFIEAIPLLMDEQAAEMLPRIRCHGDFSTGNILLGQNGAHYLIDFDRSFFAVVFFDSMYFSINRGWSRARTTELLRRVADTIKFEIHVSHSNLYEFARAAFVVDLIVFLAARFDVIEDERDNVCRYTLDLVSRSLTL